MFDIAKTKAVLWDLDDTLYSRVEAARQCFVGMFQTHLYAGRSKEFIRTAVDYMMTRIRRNSMIHEDAFAALEDKYPFDKPYVRENCLQYYYDNMYKFAKPFPEQLEVVKKLRALGIKTGIITNIMPDRLESQRNKLRVLELAPLFDCIVLSGELGIHKPDKGIFNHAAKLLGVTNEQCVFVGDDPVSDIGGALNAGMEAVWLDNWREYDGSYAGDPRVHRVHSVKEYFVLE